jgi:hypothetical protein
LETGLRIVPDDGMLRRRAMPRVEERVAHLEGHVNELSQGLTEVKETIRHLDDKVSRQFMWLVGIQVTTLVAVVTTLVAVVAALISRG